jgi:hypothetical protein
MESSLLAGVDDHLLYRPRQEWTVRLCIFIAAATQGTGSGVQVMGAALWLKSALRMNSFFCLSFYGSHSQDRHYDEIAPPLACVPLTWSSNQRFATPSTADKENPVSLVQNGCIILSARPSV